MKKILLTFADSRMKRSLSRVCRQANQLNFYDYIYALNESDLTDDYLSLYRSKLVSGSRGYGYWSWKPYLIKNILAKMSDGDVLQYMDAGCHLNPKGINRLSEYFLLSINASSGVVAFQAKNSNSILLPQIEGKNKFFFDQQEYKYNKADLLCECGVSENSEIINSPQIGATVIFLCKGKSSMSLVNEWIDIIEKDFRFIDNTPSQKKEREEFIEHRHDQAIFSILCKKRKIETISALEYYYPKKNSVKPDWRKLKNFPIHAKRDKDLGFLGNSMVIIKRILGKTKKILNE